jgi:hypothetical protein
MELTGGPLWSITRTAQGKLCTNENAMPVTDFSYEKQVKLQLATMNNFLVITKVK